MTSRIDKLLKVAKQHTCAWHYDYHWDRLTTDELLELSGYYGNGDLSNARFVEILEPVRFLSNKPNAWREQYESLSEEEQIEILNNYRSILKEG